MAGSTKIEDVDSKTAEEMVPIKTSGPLPLNPASLDFIPKERRVNYQRMMDGKLELAFLNISDFDSQKAYADLIATGKLRVLPDGETLASREEHKAAQEQKAKDILALVDKQAADERARRQRAAFEKDRDELRKKYGFND